MKLRLRRFKLTSFDVIFIEKYSIFHHITIELEEFTKITVKIFVSYI